MSKLYIKGISHCIPEGRMTNDEILQIFKEKNKSNFSDKQMDYMLYGNKRKLEFLGISTRSFCNNCNLENITSMAVKVSEKAILDAELNKSEIDCIIFTSVSNPFKEPSFALFLGKELGIEKIDYFDINDTCNGFLKSMEIAKLYIESGKYKNVLIVTSEDPFEISKNFEDALIIKNEDEVDNIVSYLFVGSGASAVVLSKTGKEHEFLNYIEEKNINNWDSTLFLSPFIKLSESRFSDKDRGIWADGRSISSTIIKDMPGFIKNNLIKLNLKSDKIDKVFIHQLGDNVTFATLKNLNIDKDKLPVNKFNEFGNLACANIPVALSIAKEKELLKEGDNIILLSSSCGISYSMVHIIW